MAADRDGNVVIAGVFEDRLVIEDDETELIGAGRGDMFVASWTVDGSHRWTRRFGSAGEDNVFDAVMDDEGNTYLSGVFAGDVVFDDERVSTTGPDDQDVVVVRLDPDGQVDWAVRAGTANADGGNEIALGPDGTLAVLADTAGGTFTAVGLDPLEAAGRDALVLTMDRADGRVRWAGQVTGGGGARGKCLAVGSDGTVYMGGDHGGQNTVVGGSTREVLATFGRADAFLAAFDAGGTLGWTRSWGGSGDDLCKGLAVDGAGDLYVVGQFAGLVDFAGVSLDGSGTDLYVWKLDAGGLPYWLRHIRAAGDLTGAEVVDAPDGGVLFGHRIRADTTYGTSAEDIVLPLPVAGTAWPVLVGYDADGDVTTTLLADDAEDTNVGELVRSGRRLYVDLPLRSGSLALGGRAHVSTGTKDAVLAAIDLPAP